MIAAEAIGPNAVRGRTPSVLSWLGSSECLLPSRSGCFLVARRGERSGAVIVGLTNGSLAAERGPTGAARRMMFVCSTSTKKDPVMEAFFEKRGNTSRVRDADDITDRITTWRAP